MGLPGAPTLESEALPYQLAQGIWCGPTCCSSQIRHKTKSPGKGSSGVSLLYVQVSSSHSALILHLCGVLCQGCIPGSAEGRAAKPLGMPSLCGRAGNIWEPSESITEAMESTEVLLLKPLVGAAPFKGQGAVLRINSLEIVFNHHPD